MNIQPEHTRKAYVAAYASEIKFKLVVMLTIWVLVILSGCGTAKPYATLALGYQIDSNSDYLVRTARSYQCDRNLQFNGEIGIELPRDFTIGYHHQSWVFCGGPLNSKPEIYQDDIRITKKFGGYK